MPYVPYRKVVVQGKPHITLRKGWWVCTDLFTKDKARHVLTAYKAWKRRCHAPDYYRYNVRS